MEIKRYECSNKLIWNEFVSKVVKWYFPLDRNYLDYHQDRFIDHSVLILKEQNSCLISNKK
jgi:hypothetical protein